MRAQAATGGWHSPSGPSDSAATVAVHLDALARIAFDHEPDWDAVFEGAGHDWCGDTSKAAARYLAENAVDARVVTGGFRGWHHTWLELADGTIVDLTIDQYIDRTEDRCVDHREVPWQQTADGALVAVVDPRHPLHASYQRPDRPVADEQAGDAAG